MANNNRNTKGQYTKTVSQQLPSIWTPLGTSNYLGRIIPNDNQLLLAYQTIPLVYACANKNANTVAGTTIRLFSVNKAATNTTKRSKAITATDPIRKRFRKDHYRMTGDAEVTEVTEHPLLDLLYEVNDQINGSQLWWLTDLYLEILGRSYWKVDRNPVADQPDKIWILPSHQVRAVLDKDTGFISGYRYQPAQGTAQTFSLDDPEFKIIPFSFANLEGPYTNYLSPLTAAYQAACVSGGLTDYESALIGNRARPDFMLLPKDGNEYSEDNAKKLLREFENKFSGRGNGRGMIADGAYTYIPLNFSPMDLGSIEISGKTDKQVCNAFGIPEGLFSKDSNRASAETAKYDHAESAILPRLKLIEQQLNALLVPMFGDERLFLCFDNPVPEDEESERMERETQLKEFTFVAAQGVMTDDEIRAVAGLEPLTPAEAADLDGNDEAASTDAQAAPADPLAATPDATPVGDQAPAVATNDLRATVGGAAQVLQTQEAYYSGTIPRDAAVANLILLYGFSESDAQRLFPNEAPDAPRNEAATPKPNPAEVLQPINDQVAAGKMPRSVAISLAAISLDIPETEAKKLVGYPVKHQCQDGCNCQKAKAPKGGIRPNREVEDRLEKTLRDHFKRQRDYYLDKISKGFDEVITKDDRNEEAKLPDEFVPLDEWTEDLAYDVKPMIEIIATDGGETLEARVGASPDVFSVVPAEIDKAVAKSSLKLAQSTINTTTKNLNDALEQLRGQIREGILQGDPVKALTKRVQEVFENATEERARSIAHTETQRAVHEGLRIAAKASGVVKGFRFLVSDDACPECAELEGKEIGLDDTFTDNGYDDSMLPIHVNCRCSVTEILDNGQEVDNGDDGEED